MLSHQVAKRPNNPSLSFWLVSGLACIKFKLLCILIFTQGCEYRVQTRMLTARQDLIKRKHGKVKTQHVKLYILTVTFQLFLQVYLSYNLCALVQTTCLRSMSRMTAILRKGRQNDEVSWLVGKQYTKFKLFQVKNSFYYLVKK